MLQLRRCHMETVILPPRWFMMTHVDVKDGMTLASLIAMGGHKFLKAFDGPLLLIKTKNPPTRSYETTVKFDDRDVSLTGFIEPHSLIIPLRKTADNGCPDHITVGRFENNDIIISDHTISKVHGWFVPPRGNYDLWRFCDNNSTNGSELNLRKMPPTSPSFIRSGDELNLGGIEILFLHQIDAHGLCKYVESAWHTTQLSAAQPDDTLIL